MFMSAEIRWFRMNVRRCIAGLARCLQLLAAGKAYALEMTKRMIIQKTRWIRTYDTSRAAIVEIPLQADEKPLNGQPLPQQGCNVEISKIQIAEDPRQWWTLGFEAFGDLDTALLDHRWRWDRLREQFWK